MIVNNFLRDHFIGVHTDSLNRFKALRVLQYFIQNVSLGGWEPNSTWGERGLLYKVYDIVYGHIQSL